VLLLLRLLVLVVVVALDDVELLVFKEWEAVEAVVALTHILYLELLTFLLLFL
jgi:hypothetical protein